jgi:hypothetical protein
VTVAGRPNDGHTYEPFEVNTYPTIRGGWVVAVRGQWLPGVYDSDDTAQAATDIDEGRLVQLAGRDAIITRAQLEGDQDVGVGS